MQLYAYALSGHSHRVRLFLSLLGLEHTLVDVDLRAGAHKTPEHLARNPFGQVPVLVDGDTTIADSTAILVYLARKHGATDWLPEAPAAAAAVQRWLSVASNEVANSVAVARAIVLFDRPADPREPIARAHALLAKMDAHLAGRDWLATDAPTLADVALYAYVARAPEGNVDLAGYAQVRAWLQRVEALPRFVPFAETPIGLSAVAA